MIVEHEPRSGSRFRIGLPSDRLTEDEGQDIAHLLVKLLAGRTDPVTDLLLDAQQERLAGGARRLQPRRHLVAKDH